MAAHTKWLRTREAAKHLNISASTLEKMRMTGDGPAFCRAGRRLVVYDLAELDRWLEASRNGAPRAA